MFYISTLLMLLMTHLCDSGRDGSSLMSPENQGELCQFPDGVSGVCQPLESCLGESGGIIRRDKKIVRCSSSSQILHVCCRKPDQIADKLCQVWTRYWWRKSVKSNNTCVEQHTLIHGGTEAGLGEFPNMANIGTGNKDERETIEWICGGSLITPLFVLTAAHCIKRASNMVIALGEHDTQVTNKIDKIDRIDLGFPEGLLGMENIIRNLEATVAIEQLFEVERTISYPEYEARPSYIYHDIALIQLKKPAILTHRVLPACLTSQYQSVLSNLHFVVAGWGALNYRGERVSRLLKVRIKFINPVMCLRSFKHIDPPLGITNDMFCAGDEGKDSCSGDSGGPLMADPKTPCGPRRISGIVSFGEGCYKFGVYTKVSSYIDWITGIVAPELVQDF